MKLNAPFLAVATVLTLALATQSQFAAQIGVVGVTLGIFFGTLSLRRPGADPTTTNPGHG